MRSSAIQFIDERLRENLDILCCFYERPRSDIIREMIRDSMKEPKWKIPQGAPCRICNIFVPKDDNNPKVPYGKYICNNCLRITLDMHETCPLYPNCQNMVKKWGNCTGQDDEKAYGGA